MAFNVPPEKVALPVTIIFPICQVPVPLGTVTMIVRFTVVDFVTLYVSGVMVVFHPVEVDAERVIDTGSPSGSLSVAHPLKVAVPSWVEVTVTS